MSIKEIKAYLETNKDNEEVKAFIAWLKQVKETDVEEFILTKEGKKWLGSKNDSFFTKGLATWKENNLETLVENEYKKKHPDTDPKDLELKKLQDKIQAMENETKREKLTNKALLLADEKKLPKKILNFFIGNNEETTVQNIESLHEVFSEAVQKAVEDRLKDNTYVPPKGDKDRNGKNPWSKEHRNLTEQGRIIRENPELAKKLQAEAK